MNWKREITAEGLLAQRTADSAAKMGTMRFFEAIFANCASSRRTTGLISDSPAFPWRAADNDVVQCSAYVLSEALI